MEEKSLAGSFRNSLTEEVSGCVGEFVEIGIDSVLEEGVLKEIPFISTAVRVYRIGKSIHERFHIKKIAVFLKEINDGVADELKREEYQKKFESNKEYRNRELEYILILIDRYVGIEKAQMLAKLYLAYLDGIILWEELTMYAEVIDRFLWGDYALLSSSKTFTTMKDMGTAALQRLVGLGLVIEEIRKSNVEEKGGTIIIDDPEVIAKKERNYHWTEFGEQLVVILGKSVNN